jgi:hypothetical protein
LHYSRLLDSENLQQALQQNQLATVKSVQIDQRWQFALAAFFLMTLIYALPLLKKLTCNKVFFSRQK